MIPSSLKKIARIIAKNRSKIFLLFFLQIIFFIILSLILYHTMTPAMQHARNALEYYDEINMTESPGMFDYLGNDPLLIYRNYRNMMFYFKFMILFSILAVIIIQGLIWAITDNLINKKNLKQSLNYFTNFGIITLIFIALFYLLIFNPLRSSLAALEYSLLPLVGTSIIFIVLLYLLFISFSLIDKRELKEILKLTFSIGIKKFPRIVLIYIINLFVITSFSYLLYLTIDANIILLIIATILFVLSFVFTRLFLIISLNEFARKLYRK